LKTVEADNQTILHCSNCGASFFEPNGINRISILTAQKLSSDHAGDEISGEEKLCPRDKSVMKTVADDEAVPTNVTLLRCPTCRGIFAYPDDLWRFKSAQKAKLEFFKLWDKPLPTLRAVMLFSFFALISATIIIGGYSAASRRTTQTQAENVISHVNFTLSGRYLLLTFKTATPMTSSLVLSDKKTGKITTKVVSDQPATVHYLTISDINKRDEIYYVISAVDNSGSKVTTEEKRLAVTP